MEILRYAVEINDVFDDPHLSERGRDLVTFQPESKSGFIKISEWHGKYFPNLFSGYWPCCAKDAQNEIHGYLRDNVVDILSGVDQNIRISCIKIMQTDQAIYNRPEVFHSFVVIITLSLCNDFTKHIEPCYSPRVNGVLEVNDSFDFNFSIYEDAHRETGHYGIEKSCCINDCQVKVSQYAHRKAVDGDEYWYNLRSYIFDSRCSSQYFIRECIGLSDPAPALSDCNLYAFGTIRDRVVDYIPIEKLGLQKKTYSLLMRAGYYTIADLIERYEKGGSYTKRDRYIHPFERIKGFGSVCAKDLEERMQACGYTDFSLTSPSKSEK